MTPLLFIFDLDGTLIDSRADLALATNAMRALHQLPPLPLETVASFVGDGVRTLAIRALEGAPVDPDLAARQISVAYAENLIVHTTPYPSVDEGLRRLHRAGHSLALVTNKPGPHTRRIVAHFGWTELFSVILGGGDTEELKPSPLPLRTVLAQTGYPPDKAWMVGDHHTDLAAARRAGIGAVYLTHGMGHQGAETPTLTFPDFRSFTTHFCPPSPDGHE